MYNKVYNQVIINTKTPHAWQDSEQINLLIRIHLILSSICIRMRPFYVIFSLTREGYPWWTFDLKMRSLNRKENDLDAKQLYNHIYMMTC